MGAMFFQNGQSLGATAGWAGYTGTGNNYVVRYDFTTGATGASQVVIALNNIGNKQGTGTAEWGIKVSTSPTAYVNAGPGTPSDGQTKQLTFSGSYSMTLEAYNLNLPPYTTCYIFVYVANISGGGCYFNGGWGCTNPGIYPSGTGGSSGGGGSSSENDTISLGSITKTVYTGGQVSITVNRSNMDVTNRLNASFKYNGETLWENNRGEFTGGFSITCPRSWFNKYTNISSMYINVKITSFTYPNTSGEINTGFNLICDSNMVPVLNTGAVSASVLNTGSAATFTSYIQGISKARISFNSNYISMSNTAGARITQYRVKYTGFDTWGGSNSIDTDILQNTSTVITCIVTDSRGRSASTNITINALAYSPPTISDVQAERCLQNGTLDLKGTYISVSARATCASLGGQNSVTLRARYKPVAGDYGEYYTLTSGVSLTVGGGLVLITNSYIVEISAQDTIGSVTSITALIDADSYTVFLKEGGKAVGLGKEPVNNKAVEIAAGWKLWLGETSISETQLQALLNLINN